MTSKIQDDQFQCTLNTATELEHTLMCAYLFAAFSMKKFPAEYPDHVERRALRLAELERNRNWESKLTMIARQEMNHLANVENLLSGFNPKPAPYYSHPDFPIDASDLSTDWYVPPIHLERFDLAVATGFSIYEAPFSIGPAKSRPALLAARHNQPMQRFALQQCQTLSFSTVGDFYAQLQAYIDGNWSKIAVGDPNLQVQDLPGLGFNVNVLGMRENGALQQARADLLIEEIVNQGEGGDQGPYGPNPVAHFRLFVELMCQLMDQQNTYRQQGTPCEGGFAGSLPCVANPTVRPGCPGSISDPVTVTVMSISDRAYALMLDLLMTFNGKYQPPLTYPIPEVPEFPPLTGSIYLTAFFPIMTNVVRPLGEILARLRAFKGDAQGYEVPTAGASFQVIRPPRVIQDCEVEARVLQEIANIEALMLPLLDQLEPYPFDGSCRAEVNDVFRNVYQDLVRMRTNFQAYMAGTLFQTNTNTTAIIGARPPQWAPNETKATFADPTTFPFPPTPAVNAAVDQKQEYTPEQIAWNQRAGALVQAYLVGQNYDRAHQQALLAELHALPSSLAKQKRALLSAKDLSAANEALAVRLSRQPPNPKAAKRWGSEARDPAEVGQTSKAWLERHPNYLRLDFDGFVTVRLSTDPDPSDEPRGVSGYTYALMNEPPLDQMIWAQQSDFFAHYAAYFPQSQPNYLDLRDFNQDSLPHYVANGGWGVYVRGGQFQQGHQSHPLKAAAEGKYQVRFLGPDARSAPAPVFAGRNDITASGSYESFPIVPFDLSISDGPRELVRANDPISPAYPDVYNDIWKIPNSTFYPARLPREHVANSLETLNFLGIADNNPVGYFNDRAVWLNERIRAAEAAGDQAALQGYRSRLYMLYFFTGSGGTTPQSRRLETRLPLVTYWQHDLIGNRRHVDAALLGSARVRQDAPWHTAYWMGGYEGDLMICGCGGSLYIPLA